MQKVRYQHHNSICEPIFSRPDDRYVCADDQWDPAEVCLVGWCVSDWLTEYNYLCNHLSKRSGRIDIESSVRCTRWNE